jgi:hypothetical protein
LFSAFVFEDVAGVIQRCWLAIAFAWLTAASIHVVHGMTTTRPYPGPVSTANP